MARQGVSMATKLMVVELAERGWYQARIAVAMGLSQGCVSRIISGKIYPARGRRLEYHRIYNGTKR